MLPLGAFAYFYNQVYLPACDEFVEPGAIHIVGVVARKLQTMTPQRRLKVLLLRVQELLYEQTIPMVDCGRVAFTYLKRPRSHRISALPWNLLPSVVVCTYSCSFSQV